MHAITQIARKASDNDGGMRTRILVLPNALVNRQQRAQHVDVQLNAELGG